MGITTSQRLSVKVTVINYPNFFLFLTRFLLDFLLEKTT